MPVNVLSVITPIIGAVLNLTTADSQTASLVMRVHQTIIKGNVLSVTTQAAGATPSLIIITLLIAGLAIVHRVITSIPNPPLNAPNVTTRTSGVMPNSAIPVLWIVKLATRLHRMMIILIRFHNVPNVMVQMGGTMTNFNKGSFELYLSFSVLLFLALVYFVYELLTEPAGSHPFGHSLGILGTILMLFTEVLYSIRKRSQLINFGRARHWLSFHIFTGIVGPALVLMHTGMQFRGVAGFTMVLTILVVASGFLGRYIFTAVPRTMAGIEVDRRTLANQIKSQQNDLAIWTKDKSKRLQDLVHQEMTLSIETRDLSTLEVLTWRLQEWRERRRLRSVIRRLEQTEQQRIQEIEQLLRHQHRLTRQLNSLQTVRKMMAWWHTFHVPLGLSLFTAIFIHIVASLYYSGV